jgi:hypothetical protein
MCRILINGNVELGYGTGINISESTTNVPVKILGSVYTQELCPVDVNVSVSMSSVHIQQSTLEQLGLYSQGTTKDIVTFPGLTIELVKTLDDPIVIARAFGCKPAGRGLPLGRGGIIARDVRFDALRFEVVTQA